MSETLPDGTDQPVDAEFQVENIDDGSDVDVDDVGLDCGPADSEYTELS